MGENIYCDLVKFYKLNQSNKSNSVLILFSWQISTMSKKSMSVPGVVSGDGIESSIESTTPTDSWTIFSRPPLCGGVVV